MSVSCLFVFFLRRSNKHFLLITSQPGFITPPPLLDRIEIVNLVQYSIGFSISLKNFLTLRSSSMQSISLFAVSQVNFSIELFFSSRRYTLVFYFGLARHRSSGTSFEKGRGTWNCFRPARGNLSTFWTCLLICVFVYFWDHIQPS